MSDYVEYVHLLAFRGPRAASRSLRRQDCCWIESDTFMTPHLEAAKSLATSGQLAQAAERAIGPLA